MHQIREILRGDTVLAAEALLLLRPRWDTADAVSAVVDTHLRPSGYRLVGVFEHQSHAAASVIGFREMWSTAFGHYMYVDDLSTLETARGNGYADELLQWVIAEAKRRRCTQVHLDSGVDPDRAPAHRLYMRKGLRISAHHFSIDVSSR